jgi:hypothetical protein
VLVHSRSERPREVRANVEDGAVRLPDLNWPDDLFADADVAASEVADVVPWSASAEPTLWLAMLNAWMGNADVQNRHARVPANDIEELAW